MDSAGQRSASKNHDTRTSGEDLPDSAPDTAPRPPSGTADVKRRLATLYPELMRAQQDGSWCVARPVASEAESPEISGGGVLDCV